MTVQKIDTDRLVLDKLCVENAPFIYELVNTADWIKNIGDRHVHSVEAAQNYVQKIIDNPSINYWTVSLQNDTSSIGIITFIKRDYLEHHDIGFAFLPQYAKQGYAYEATKAVLDQVTKNQPYSPILAITIKDNSSSIRLLEKLGFVFEQLIEVDNASLLRYSLKRVI